MVKCKTFTLKNSFIYSQVVFIKSRTRLSERLDLSLYNYEKKTPGVVPLYILSLHISDCVKENSVKERIFLLK